MQHKTFVDIINDVDIQSKFSQRFLILPPYRWEPNYTTSSGKASGKEIPIGNFLIELFA